MIINDLHQNGFTHYGALTNNILRYNNNHKQACIFIITSNNQPIQYQNGSSDIIYIGYGLNGINKRFNQIINNPGSSQGTNRRIHDYILNNSTLLFFRPCATTDISKLNTIKNKLIEFFIQDHQQKPLLSH